MKERWKKSYIRFLYYHYRYRFGRIYDPIKFLLMRLRYNLRFSGIKHVAAFKYDLRMCGKAIYDPVLERKALLSVSSDRIRSRFTRDEFDKSLDMNAGAMIHLNRKQQDDYRRDLVKRRQIAHERDLD